MLIGLGKNSSDRDVRGSLVATRSFARLGLCLLLWGLPALAQALQPPNGTGALAAQPFRDSEVPGSISGTIVDPSGASVSKARVELARGDRAKNQETSSGDDGQFSFGGIVPGPFELTIAAEGFAAQAFSGTLHEGEIYNAPRIALTLATEKTEMRIVVPGVEVADEQIKEEEKQRVLGFVPNFYVSYFPDAAPLSTKQKFELAWKTTLDPVTLVLTGAIAGGQQARDDFKGYGQGAQGYAKRFGASYGDVFAGTFIGSAILPSVLKQDPRYFYKGRGSKRSRILYALANSVICKGDNGHWQPNYSSIAGNLAAGGISNLYYPANDRNGIGTVVSTALIRLGETAVANIFQEFFVPKMTPNLPNRGSGQR